MRLSGARIVIECLREQSVSCVFGYPGGTVLPIYDELRQNSDNLTHYLTAHEQGAAHAADGYARSTGKTGVCIATSGPGACNLVTGIAAAYMDSSPVVAITGNVSYEGLGKDSFQEIDIFGVLMPITKHGFIVKDISQLSETIRRAFFIASEGRKGPVIVDITKNVLTDYYDYKKEQIQPSEVVMQAGNFNEAVKLIESASKPLVYAGGGVISSQASDELSMFANKIKAPAITSLMGIGALSAECVVNLGMAGMHGSAAANKALQACDLLIGVGVRFSDRIMPLIKKKKHPKILHIDIDPAEINKNANVSAALIGNTAKILSTLTDGVKITNNEYWIPKATGVKQPKDAFVRSIYRRIDITSNTIIVTDVGQHQMWAARLLRREIPRTFITSGGLGAMGFGLGAAAGAAVGNPSKTVVCIMGDGGFRMVCGEIMTQVRHKLSVITVIINNDTLGMVRELQMRNYGGMFYSVDYDEPADLAGVATACGALGLRASNTAEFEEAFKKALEFNGPAVIDCLVDKDALVLL